MLLMVIPDFARHRPAPPLTRGRLEWRLGPRPNAQNAGRGAQSDDSLVVPAPRLAHCALRLLRVQLDDQLLLRRNRNVRARGALEHSAAEALAIDGEPGQRSAARRLIHGCLYRDHLARLLPNANLFARLHLIARNVDRALIHFDMTMANELPCGLAARRKSQPIDHVVETTLERSEQIVAGDSRQRRDALERVVKLRLTHAIDALDLLLLAELLRILGRLAPTCGVLTVLTWRVRTSLDWTLLGEALGALEKELRSFPPTLFAARPHITTHDLHSPTLGWTAAVMRNRRHVLDGLDLKTGRRERLDGRFTTTARALDANMDSLDAEAHRFARALLGSDRRSEGRALLRALEASLA